MEESVFPHVFIYSKTYLQECYILLGATTLEEYLLIEFSLFLMQVLLRISLKGHKVFLKIISIFENYSGAGVVIWIDMSG